jgi:hypothetical protein
MVAGGAGDARAYDVVGIFLNFPQGDLDAVTRINVYIAPDPFQLVKDGTIESYPPAYSSNPAFITSIFPDFATMGYDDYQGALGSGWQRLSYDGVNRVQSYGSTTSTPPSVLLVSEDSRASGTPVIVDGYVYTSFPAINRMELVGYPETFQTTLNLIAADVPFNVSTPIGTRQIRVNFWQYVAEPDNTPPVVYLNNQAADDEVDWTVGVVYEDQGVTAEDNVDGAIAYQDLVINVEGVEGDPAVLLDTNADIGTTYAITYSATDARGNVSDLRTRTVTLVPDRPPVIYLNGLAVNDEVNVTKGTVYTDQGVTARDDVDGDLTAEIEVRVDGELSDPSDIDTATSGVNYVITYHVQDSLAQPAVERQRTVHVVEPSAAPGGGGGGGGCFISVSWAVFN